MRSAIFPLGILAATMLAIAPAPARACGQGSNYGGGIVALGVGLLAVGAADVAMTIWDGGSAAAKRHPSIGYGVLETLVAGPQFGLGIYGLTHSGGNSGTGWLAVYTVWMGLLTTHGLWTVITAPRATAAPPDAVEPQPPPEPVPQLQMSLGPTYVPVGQLAQPGFGVAGRF